MCILDETELPELAANTPWVRLLAPLEVNPIDVSDNRVCPKCQSTPHLLDTNWHVLYCRHTFWDEYADVVAQALPTKQFWVIVENTLGGGEVTESTGGRLILYADQEEVEEEIREQVREFNEDGLQDYTEDNWYPKRVQDAPISPDADINLTTGEKHLILFLRARDE